MGLVKFVEQAVQVGGGRGSNGAGSEQDADKLYQEGVLKPVKEAQAPYSGGEVQDKAFGLFETLRKQATIERKGCRHDGGPGAGHFTGYIIDHVIRPLKVASSRSRKPNGWALWFCRTCGDLWTSRAVCLDASENHVDR